MQDRFPLVLRACVPPQASRSTPGISSKRIRPTPVGGLTDIVRINPGPRSASSDIACPLIVLQGANDRRILQGQSDEIVEAVRANGVPVESVWFDDEGHGFRNRDNEVEGYRTICEFLDLQLAEKGARMPMTSL